MRINCLALTLFCLLSGLTASAQQAEPDIQDDTQDTSETESAETESAETESAETESAETESAETESAETQTERFQPSERIKADDQIYFPVDI